MSIFNDLKASLEEAVEIKNENKKASRVTLYAVENVKEIRKNATAGIPSSVRNSVKNLHHSKKSD